MCSGRGNREVAASVLAVPAITLCGARRQSARPHMLDAPVAGAARVRGGRRRAVSRGGVIVGGCESVCVCVRERERVRAAQ